MVDATNFRFCDLQHSNNYQDMLLTTKHVPRYVAKILKSLVLYSSMPVQDITWKIAAGDREVKVF